MHPAEPPGLTLAVSQGTDILVDVAVDFVSGRLAVELERSEGQFVVTCARTQH